MKQTDAKKKNPFDVDSQDGFLKNKILMALPGLEGGVFDRSVIYICAHSDAGAMGIVLNQKVPEIVFKDILSQLGLRQSEMVLEPMVHFGGPVETARGFVLHSTDYARDDTVQINDQMAITGTIDILKAIAKGKGPMRSLFALGYAGWGPGQLEEELQNNAWLTMSADEDFVFDPDITHKWEKALDHIGVDPTKLSSFSGFA